MATAVAEELATLLERLLSSPSVGGTIARGIVTGISSFGAWQLINGVESIISGRSGSEQARANVHRIPQYAIIDIHSNKIVTFVSRKRVYRFLLRPRRRSSRTKPTFIIAPKDQEVVKVTSK